MKEKQWLTTTRPHRLLAHLGGTASERKLRLLAVACCYRIRALLTEPLWWSAVEVAERFADGLGDAHEIGVARDRTADLGPLGNEGAAVLICCTVGGWFVPSSALASAGAAARNAAERKAQADLARDIFGNPFRSVTFSPDWRTDTAKQLAHTMYEAREFSAMPILADALQDAGCDSDDILTHCRDANQVHVRGCWVIDLVLDKV